MTHVLRDVRFAFRMLIRKPVFAVAAILTAALGVGVTTAMFSVVNGVVLRPLPYADAKDLVYLGVRLNGPLPFFATSTPDFMDWRERLGSIEHVGAMEPHTIVVAHDGEATRIVAARMSPDVLPMFRVVPQLGRPFSDDEFQTGTGSVALLSYGLWQRWGADPDIVGRKISTMGSNQDVEIIGVLPRNFQAPAATRMKPPELWMPLPVDGAAYASSRTSRNLRVVGRLVSGTTVDEARREAEALGLVLASVNPDAYVVSESKQLTIGVASLREQTIGRTGNVVVAETALALILLSGAGLLAASFFNLQQVDPGFEGNNLQAVSIGLIDEFASNDQRVSYLRELAVEVKAVPGVESVSFISTLPVNGYDAWAPDIFPEGTGRASFNDLIGLVAGAGYFETMGIRVLAGRGITARDEEAALKVAAISETAAGRMWPGEDPIGKRFKISEPEGPWVTVIGLVADVRTVDLVSDSSGEIYVPHAQNSSPDWMHAVVRGRLGDLKLAGPFREIMKRLSPNIPFEGVHPLSARVSTSVNSQRFNAFMWVIFGAAALLLAAVGIYATLLNLVGRRTQEIGIRMAVGATPPQMFQMVIREGLLLTVCGSVIGLIVTLALSRLLASFLFGVTATDPSTLAASCTVLAAVALLACYVPARRATKADPAQALRAN